MDNARPNVKYAAEIPQQSGMYLVLSVISGYNIRYMSNEIFSTYAMSSILNNALSALLLL